MMSLRMVLFCWSCLSVFVSGCGTASQEDRKDYPKAQVIGHGTQPGSSWLGLGVTIPLPSKSNSASASPTSSSGDGQPDSKR
jgi:hypothetical protein